MSAYQRILVIPDTQLKKGVPTRHLTAISNYIEAKRPDVILHLGDHFDMPSLSSYSLALEKEGKRYADDIAAGVNGMTLLTAFRKKARGYRPRMVFTEGNHERRVQRTVDNNPALEGVISAQDFRLPEFGWTVYPFLKVARLAGWEASHYFVSGPKGNPVSSAAALLRERQNSAIQGHVQSFQIATHSKTRKMGIFAGTAYMHDEAYLGPQANTCPRQIIVINEAKDGRGDLMIVSLSYLLREWT